jgi:hypothetical protein
MSWPDFAGKGCLLATSVYDDAEIGVGKILLTKVYRGNTARK